MNTENICEDGALLLSYTAGALDREESIRVGRHLTSCPHCQEMVRENEKLIQVYRAVRMQEAAHPSAEVLVQLAEGSSTPELSEARAHVDACRECLEVFSVLTRVEADMEGPEPSKTPRHRTSRLKDFWLLFPSWLASPVPAYVLVLLLLYPAYLGLIGIGGLSERLENLEAPALLSPPVALESGRERGVEEPRLRIDRSGEHRVVTFFVPIAPERYRYRVELTRRGERIFFSVDARSFDGIGTFALLLPEGALLPGSYSLRVEEVEKQSGELANVIEFEFTMTN